jgi:hypothetical protein
MMVRAGAPGQIRKSSPASIIKGAAVLSREGNLPQEHHLCWQVVPPSPRPPPTQTIGLIAKGSDRSINNRFVV